MAHTTHPAGHVSDIIHGRSPASHRSGRAMLVWAAIIAAFVVAAVLVVLATTSGTSTTQIETPVAPVAPAEPGVPLSPDQAERHLAELDPRI